ncbi:hypothetical protein [Leptospira vanthielii]|uniref:hypothetical protein n=1 Tax=Leptospira vanthielii TaxID=293085 RepID=UPI001FD11CC8|nr:hypothetical protein [Leptospira vanthielii]
MKEKISLLLIVNLLLLSGFLIQAVVKKETIRSDGRLVFLPLPVRLQVNFADLKTSEFCLQYYRSDYDLKIGAESYFFQEGEAELYLEAKYAGIRFLEGNTDGDKLFVGWFV